MITDSFFFCCVWLVARSMVSDKTDTTDHQRTEEDSTGRERLIADILLIEDILRTVNWNTDSTFQRFYYRPTRQNVYAQAVLRPRQA